MNRQTSTDELTAISAAPALGLDYQEANSSPLFATVGCFSTYPMLRSTAAFVFHSVLAAAFGGAKTWRVFTPLGFVTHLIRLQVKTIPAHIASKLKRLDICWIVGAAHHRRGRHTFPLRSRTPRRVEPLRIRDALAGFRTEPLAARLIAGYGNLRAAYLAMLDDVIFSHAAIIPQLNDTGTTGHIAWDEWTNGKQAQPADLGPLFGGLS